VVLEGLHLVEVGTLTLRETVLAVELELGDLNRVLALAARAGVENHLGEQVVNTRLKLLGAGQVRSIRTNERRGLRRALSEEGRRSAQAGSIEELLFGLIVLGDERVIERTVIAGRTPA
jgi:hypothetical protein